MKPFAFLVVVLSLVLTACASTPATTEPEPAAEATEPPAADTAAESDGYGSDTAPAEDATDDTAAADEDTTDAAPAASDGSMRTYVIVPEESSVTYTVDEVFLSEGVVDATAVGVTQVIEGEIMLDAEQPQNSTISPITVDISAFESDSSRRDDAIRNRWLESAQYPIATFVPTEINGLPETYTYGESVPLQITGDLTVREVTTPVTFNTTVTATEDELRGEASTQVQMTDFGFDPPDIAGVLRAENDVALTMEFVARP